MVDRLHATKNNIRRGWTKNLKPMINYFNLGKIFTVEVELTPKCSMGCSYCYAECTPFFKNYLSTEQLYQLIDDCVEVGVKQIAWCGGEPLEMSEWPEILAYSKDKGLSNLLLTNGIMLSDIDVARKVIDLTDMLSIHIDSLNPAIWNMVHDSENGLMNLQLMGISNLLELGYDPDNIAIYVTLTTPLFKQDDYKKTIDWAYDELGVSVILYPYRSVGFAKNTPHLNPTFEQMQKAYKYRNSKDGIPSGPGFGSKFYCSTSCHVKSNGDVQGCSMVYSSYAGNLNKISFKEIYEKRSNLLTYFELHNPKNLKGKCSTCDNNTFCWGCRAASEVLTGDFKNSDPICWMGEIDPCKSVS